MSNWINIDEQFVPLDKVILLKSGDGSVYVGKLETFEPDEGESHYWTHKAHDITWPVFLVAFNGNPRVFGVEWWQDMPS